MHDEPRFEAGITSLNVDGRIKVRRRGGGRVGDEFFQMRNGDARSAGQAGRRRRRRRDVRGVFLLFPLRADSADEMLLLLLLASGVAPFPLLFDSTARIGNKENFLSPVLATRRTVMMMLFRPAIAVMLLGRKGITGINTGREVVAGIKRFLKILPSHSDGPNRP